MTDHTLYTIAAIPAADAEDAHESMLDHDDPAGRAFFDTAPTHVDGDGTEWAVISAWVRPYLAALVSEIADHFPDAEYAVTKERVESPADDDTIASEPDHGAFVVVHRDGLPPVLDGLERIETEDEIDDPLL